VAHVFLVDALVCCAGMQAMMEDPLRIFCCFIFGRKCINISWILGICFHIVTSKDVRISLVSLYKEYNIVWRPLWMLFKLKPPSSLFLDSPPHLSSLYFSILV
jgi:hypothetical protein